MQTSTPVKSTNVRMVAPWYLRGGFSALGTLSPPLASVWAEKLFMTAPRPAAPAREVEALGTAHAGTQVIDGKRLATWTWGTGPTVLLVHGWGGRGGQLAGFVPGLLASGYSVVAFDGPGHGASEGAMSSLVEHGRAVKGLAEALPSQVHAIVTHSMGGAAAAYAFSEGLTVSRAVFVAPPSAASDWVRQFAGVLGLSDAVVGELRRRVEDRLKVSWERLDMAVLAPEMTIPLLVVHDKDDREVPWTSGALTAEAWPGAELHTTRGLGHKRILDDADVIERVVGFAAQPICG